MAVHSFSKQYEYESMKNFQSLAIDSMRLSGLVASEYRDYMKKKAQQAEDDRQKALKTEQEEKEKQQKIASGIIAENPEMAEAAYGILGNTKSSSPQERAVMFGQNIPEQYASDPDKWKSVCDAVETMYGEQATEYFALPEDKKGAMSFDSYLVGQGVFKAGESPDAVRKANEEKTRQTKSLNIEKGIGSVLKSIDSTDEAKKAMDLNDDDAVRMISIASGETEAEVKEYLASERGQKYISDTVFVYQHSEQKALKDTYRTKGFAAIDSKLGISGKGLSEKGRLYQFASDSRGFKAEEYREYIDGLASNSELMEELSALMPEEEAAEVLTAYHEEKGDFLLRLGTEMKMNADKAITQTAAYDDVMRYATAPAEGPIEKSLARVLDRARRYDSYYTADGKNPVEELYIPATFGVMTSYAESMVNAAGLSQLENGDSEFIKDTIVRKAEEALGDEAIAPYRKLQPDGTYKYVGAFGEAMKKFENYLSDMADRHNEENLEWAKKTNSDLKKQMDTGVLPTGQDLVYAFKINTISNIRNLDEYSYLWTSYIDAKKYRDNLVTYSNIDDGAKQKLVSYVEQAVAGLENHTPEVGYLYGNAYLKTDEDATIAGIEGMEFDYDKELQKNIDIASSKIFKEFNPNGGDIKDSQMSVYEPKAFKEWLSRIGREKAGGYEMFQLATLWNQQFDQAKRVNSTKKDQSTPTGKVAAEKTKSDAWMNVEALIAIGNKDGAKAYVSSLKSSVEISNDEAEKLMTLTGLDDEASAVKDLFKKRIIGKLKQKDGNMDLTEGLPMILNEFFIENQNAITRYIAENREADFDTLFDQLMGQYSRTQKDKAAIELEAGLNDINVRILSQDLGDNPEAVAYIVMHGNAYGYDVETLSRQRLGSPSRSGWYCGNSTWNNLNTILAKSHADPETRISEMNEELAHRYGYNSYAAVDNDFALSLIQMNRECAIYEYTKSRCLEKMIDPDGELPLSFATMDGRTGLYDPGTQIFYEISEIGPSIRRNEKSNKAIAGKYSVQNGGLLVTGYRMMGSGSNARELSNGNVWYNLSSVDIARDADENIVVNTWSPVYGGGQYQMQAYQEMLDATYDERNAAFEEEVNRRMAEAFPSKSKGFIPPGAIPLTNKEKRDRDKKRSEIEKEIYHENKDIVPIELWNELSGETDRTLENKLNSFRNIKYEPETYGFMNSKQDPYYGDFIQYLLDN